MATAFLFAVSSTSGNVTLPDRALGTPDLTYTGDGNTGNNWTARWRMGTRPEAIIVTGLQSVRLYVASGSNSGGGTIDAVNIYQGGALITTASPTAIYVNAPQEVVVTFDGSLLNTEELVDIELVTTGDGGSPNARDAVALDAIRWELVYELDLPPGTFFNTWNGSSWVTGELKRWDGAAWTPAYVKRWNGTSWVLE